MLNEFNLLGLDWICDDSEYPCLVDDYMAKRASNEIDAKLYNAVKLALQSV